MEGLSDSQDLSCILLILLILSNLLFMCRRLLELQMAASDLIPPRLEDSVQRRARRIRRSIVRNRRPPVARVGLTVIGHQLRSGDSGRRWEDTARLC